MRSLRWLLLAAMVLIAAAVAGIYHSQRLNSEASAAPPPPNIPLDTKTSAPDFEWGQSANGMPAVKGFAKNMKQSADGSRCEYFQLELRIYQKDGQHFDSVKSAYAQLTTDRSQALFARRRANHPRRSRHRHAAPSADIHHHRRHQLRQCLRSGGHRSPRRFHFRRAGMAPRPAPLTIRNTHAQLPSQRRHEHEWQRTQQ